MRSGHRFAGKSVTLCGVDTATATVGTSFSLPFVVYDQQLASATVSTVLAAEWQLLHGHRGPCCRIPACPSQHMEQDLLTRGSTGQEHDTLNISCITTGDTYHQDRRLLPDWAVQGTSTP
jgi:hypothetical protein